MLLHLCINKLCDSVTTFRSRLPHIDMLQFGMHSEFYDNNKDRIIIQKRLSYLSQKIPLMPLWFCGDLFCGLQYFIALIYDQISTCLTCLPLGVPLHNDEILDSCSKWVHAWSTLGFCTIKALKGKIILAQTTIKSLFKIKKKKKMIAIQHASGIEMLDHSTPAPS